MTDANKAQVDRAFQQVLVQYCPKCKRSVRDGKFYHLNEGQPRLGIPARKRLFFNCICGEWCAIELRGGVLDIPLELRLMWKTESTEA